MSKHSLFGNEYEGAVFSPCRTWRYTLWRHWNPEGKHVLFIMLNPSTADETTEDPTIRRTINYAHDWGFGGVVICNLFAIRATQPAVMLAHSNPVGTKNNMHILKEAKAASLVIAAWGAHGIHLGRSRDVVRLLEKNGCKLHYLKLTNSGEPGHPLYLKKCLRPQPLIKHDGLLQIDIEAAS